MKKFFCLLSIAAFVLTLMGGSSGSIDNKYSISAIRAHLYYQSTGEISKVDLLDGKDHVLWNTIIGEGEAKEPSRALIIYVEIVVPSGFGGISCGSLILKATEGDNILTTQSVLLDRWVTRSEKIILPFIVYGTGCETVDINVQLEGIPAKEIEIGSLTRTVEFKCGE